MNTFLSRLDKSIPCKKESTSEKKKIVSLKDVICKINETLKQIDNILKSVIVFSVKK